LSGQYEAVLGDQKCDILSTVKGYCILAANDANTAAQLLKQGESIGS